MCWLWPLIGTGIGAILGYFLGSSSCVEKQKQLSAENADLTAKLSQLSGDVNSLSHYRDKLAHVKTVVSEYKK